MLQLLLPTHLPVTQSVPGSCKEWVQGSLVFISSAASLGDALGLLLSVLALGTRLDAGWPALLLLCAEWRAA